MRNELKSLLHTKEDREYPKMDSGNRILHWDPLQKLICENDNCKCCGSEFNMTEKTIGIATQVQLVCKNKN